MSELLPISQIALHIVEVRGHRVLLDTDLAAIYGVPTKVLNQAVKRNLERFPSDFVFQLNQIEVEDLRSQFVTSSPGHGGRRYLPFAFTEHGALMSANILKSSQAVQMSIFVVRAFVQFREAHLLNQDLKVRLDELEARYDAQFQAVFDAIRQLMEPPEPEPPPAIGFRPPQPTS